MPARLISPFRLCLVATLALACATAGLARDDSVPSKPDPAASKPVAKIPAPLSLDDAPQPLVPKHPRTEEGEDRLRALTLFAAGRMKQRRQDYPGALRYYERALRYDPRALTVARSIVPLAIRLKRYPEAVRYALKAAELEDSDPLLLRRLGIYVTEQGDWAGAVKLYERALAARKNQKDTAADILLRMEMGRLYHLTGEFKKSAQSFERVIHAIEHPKETKLEDDVKKVLLGDSGANYVLFGDSFLLAGEPDKAVAAYRKANELSPSKGLLAFNLARVHAKTGKNEKALTQLHIAFDENLGSEGVAPFELLGEVLDKLGKKSELLGRLEKLHAAHPDNVPLEYSLAEQYRRVEQFDKAEPLYAKLLKVRPTLTAYRGLVDIYRRTKRSEKLMTVLAEAVGKTASLEPLGDEGTALLDDAQTVKTLIEATRKKLADAAAEKRPSYDVLLAAALLDLESKQADSAGKFFEAAAKAKPDSAAELLLSWGIGLLMADKYAEAAAVFQKGIDRKVLPDDNPGFYYYLAGALELGGKTDQALAAARKAAEAKPDSARYLGRVGWVLYHGKRYKEAGRVYRKLVDKFDADHESEDVRQIVRESRLVLSNLCVLEGKPVDAQEWLEQVLDEYPDDISALNDLGYLWADENENLRRALKMIQQAVAAEPENRAYRDSLGWVFYRLGRYKEAVAELEKSADDKEPDAVILDHLGDAYIKNNQPDKAKDAYRRAAAAYRKSGETKKAEQAEKKGKR